MAGQAKLREVTSLVDKLNDDLEPLTIPPSERVQLLEKLKIFGRDPNNADPIFTDKGISMLLQYAFYNEDRETSRAALRVLANSMLLKPHTRQIFIDKQYAPKACLRLNTESWDDEFLLSRVLFLSTYGKVDLKDLVENHRVGESIAANLGRHEAVESGENGMMESMALDETLKLLFNFAHHCPNSVSEFGSAIPHLVSLLVREDVSTSEPLKGAPGHIVNALVTLDLNDPKHHDVFFPSGEQFKFSNRLIKLLDCTLKAYSDQELGPTATPLVRVLQLVYEKAPEDVKKSIRDALLPSDEDRKEVLGRGTSTSALLLKYATHPTSQELRTCITHLFFHISDKDPSKFVENIGYGIASAYLFENNIAVPESASETRGASGTGRPVNPITGQFLDAERPVDEPEMTEEEKEREAERLYVLFERLRATGVVNVENPVATAMREGRYRELGDDEVEELE